LTEVDREADAASAPRKTRAKRQIARPEEEKREPDLTIIVHARERAVMVSSPRNRASLDHVSMPGIIIPPDGFEITLRNSLTALYDPNRSVADVERELRILGYEFGQCLPSDLRSLLRLPDVRTVMLRHDESFNFPLELCFLDDKEDSFFIGDRIAVKGARTVLRTGS
jgi:hypothetical protein